MARPAPRPEDIASVVQTACAAYRSGDLARATYYLGMALSTDSQNGEWLGILNQVIEHAGVHAPSLIPPEAARGDPIATATRAYVLAAVDQYQEAIVLLFKAIERRPDIPYLKWAAAWLRRPGVAPGVPYDFVQNGLLPPIQRLVQDLPSPVLETDPKWPNVKAAGEMLALIRNVYPMGPQLLVTSAVVMRRLGEWEGAIELAKHASELLPGWETTAGLAAAYRDAGLEDKALVTYQEALQVDPDQISLYLDIGDTYLETERYPAAINAYKEALTIQSGHPWAQSSMAYARFKLTSDPKHKVALIRLAESDRRAWSLLCEIQEPQPYSSFLPRPGDEAVGLIEEIMRRIEMNPASAHGTTVILTVTQPGSPSVLTAFRLWCEQKGVQVKVDLRVQGVPSPDPRYPKSQVDFALWGYQGTTPVPAVNPPDSRAPKAIASVASEPFHLEIWGPKTRRLAAQMGPPWLATLLSTMVHPPALPQGMDPMSWVQRVQIAVALVIASLDDGWENSVRKRALYSLALGPVDWTVDAAVIALASLAREQPAIRPDVERLFHWLLAQAPQETSFTCYEYPLVCGLLSLGGHDEAARSRLVAWQKRLEEQRPGWQPSKTA